MWRSCAHMWAMAIVAAPSLTLEQRPIFARTLACCRKNALVVRSRSRFIRGICISGIRGVYKSRCQGDAIDCSQYIYVLSKNENYKFLDTSRSGVPNARYFVCPADSLAQDRAKSATCKIHHQKFCDDFCCRVSI